MTRLSSTMSLTVEQMVSGMSLMQTRDSKGRRTVPCGTPEVTSVALECTPSSTTSCCLCVIKSAIHLIRFL